MECYKHTLGTLKLRLASVCLCLLNFDAAVSQSHESGGVSTLSTMNHVHMHACFNPLLSKPARYAHACMYFQVTWLPALSCRDLWVSNGRHHAVHSTYAGGSCSLSCFSLVRNLKHTAGMHVMAAVNSSADLHPTAASRLALNSLALNSKFRQKSTPNK